MACPYILQNKVGAPALSCSSQLDRMGERFPLRRNHVHFFPRRLLLLMSSSFCRVCAFDCFCLLIGRHVCEALGLIGLPLNFSAGGTGGADETGANKDAHQLPVIQLETSCLQSSDFKFLGPVILTTTRSPAFASVLRSAVMRLSFSLRFSTLELEALEVSPMFRPPTDTCPGSSGF